MVVDPEFHYQNFDPPPPAPVFEPDEEEFKDPLAYIAKIRPIAQKYGAVKIKPPASWQPPFSIDIENFQFAPRIQRLNECEAISRVRMAFLNKIANFWTLQGSILKVPLVENKYLDLCKLHKEVQNEGGYDNTVDNRRWGVIAKKMGFKASSGAQLRSHYDRILLPFDIYESGIALEHAMKGSSEEKETVKSTKKPPFSRRTAAGCRNPKPDPTPTGTGANRKTPRELRNLKFQGSAGPKAAVVTQEAPPKTRPLDPMDNVVCRVCSSGDDEDRLLLCDCCDESFHTYCLLPPLPSIPKGDWRCPKCVTKEVSKPDEVFGFEQAPRKYTLHSFGEMAERFKTDHYGMPCHMVPHARVEKDFWKQVVSPNSVSVEYGADLFTDEVGSGFPKENDTRTLTNDEAIYAKAAWNLNNLPILRGSVLRHISTDISGVMVPWVYVGMCFSTFCWHNEDHWSYSINYLHWGEPKYWYAVAGEDAPKFESAMRSLAPELFDKQPDLLHHIVTMTNPRVLMDKGVDIYSVHQNAGEFVITFPRAYHAGFNAGYNFAEAVNFCPADWLPIGRSCVEHYSQMKRYNVFSHDELVCTVAGAAEDLEIPMAITVYREVLAMIEREKEERRKLLNMGVVESTREIFELIADDERQCTVCNTTCYLSAITCGCKPDSMVCLKHVDQLCSTCEPSKFCLRYRYTLAELPPIVDSLLKRTKCFDNWVEKVRKALSAPDQDKLDLDDLKSLLEEAKVQKFPAGETYEALSAAYRHAERCSNIAQQLISNKIQTRTRNQGLRGNYVVKLRLEEVEAFAAQIDALRCLIKEKDEIKEFVGKAVGFRKEAKALVESPLAVSPTSSFLDDLRETLSRGLSFDLQLPEIFELKELVERSEWLVNLDNILGFEFRTKKMEEDEGEGVEGIEEEVKDTVAISRIKELMTEGTNFPGYPQVEIRMARLQTLLTSAHSNEARAEEALGQIQEASMGLSRKLSLDAAQRMLKEMLPVPGIKQPGVDQLREAVKRTKDWIELYQDVKTNGSTLASLETLVHQSKTVPLCLQPHLGEVEHCVEVLSEFLDRLRSFFQKDPSSHSLAEILCPRQDLSALVEGQRRGMRFRQKRTRSEEWGQAEQFDSSHKMADLLERQEKQEMQLMERLRVLNKGKAAGGQGAEEAGGGSVTRKRTEHGPTLCLCHESLSNPSSPATPSAPTLECHLCCERYHAKCVYWEPYLSEMLGRYLCPRCCRGRRSPLSGIKLFLLQQEPNIGKVAVPSFEVSLLRRFIRRAEDWQRSVRDFLGCGAVKALSQPIEMDAGTSILHAFAGIATSQETPFKSPELATELEQLIVAGLLIEAEMPELKNLLELEKNVVRPVPQQNIALLEDLKSRPVPNAPHFMGGSGGAFEGGYRGPHTKARKTIGPKRPKSPMSKYGKRSRKRGSFHEDEQPCSAGNCLRPIGDAVNWVQCESGCEQWFHLLCVGLTVQSVEGMEHYVCYRCKSAL